MDAATAMIHAWQTHTHTVPWDVPSKCQWWMVSHHSSFKSSGQPMSFQPIHGWTVNCKSLSVDDCRSTWMHIEPRTWLLLYKLKQFPHNIKERICPRTLFFHETHSTLYTATFPALATTIMTPWSPKETQLTDWVDRASLIMYYMTAIIIIESSYVRLF